MLDHAKHIEFRLLGSNSSGYALRWECSCNGKSSGAFIKQFAGWDSYFAAVQRVTAELKRERLKP